VLYQGLDRGYTDIVPPGTYYYSAFTADGARFSTGRNAGSAVVVTANGVPSWWGSGGTGGVGGVTLNDPDGSGGFTADDDGNGNLNVGLSGGRTRTTA
jgi:hypothetical protein